ncbi:MAG: NAD(P)H-quinone oxidoreductase [Acidimicrobiales bacterium]
MRAVVLEEYGGPEVLAVREIPDPECGPEDLLVDVVATAMNRADLLQRMGLYPGPPTEHEVPGLEFAGTVAAVGSLVAGVEVGDAVMGIVGGGAHAERLAVHHRQVLPVPTTVTVADAGAIPEVFLTAWDALVVQGGLTAGRRALVHAGASGVGTAAIQIAKAYGADIFVTASSGKVDRCRQLGADLAIDYTATDFVDAVRDATGGTGVDVILDVIGGDYVDRNLACLAVQGRIIQVGVMGEAQAQINVSRLLPLRASLIGTVLRSRPLEEKIALTQRFKREMSGRFDNGELAPVIDRRFALDDIASAHELMATNTNVGKIVIDVGS